MMKKTLNIWRKITLYRLDKLSWLSLSPTCFGFMRKGFSPADTTLGKEQPTITEKLNLDFCIDAFLLSCLELEQNLYKDTARGHKIEQLKRNQCKNKKLTITLLLLKDFGMEHYFFIGLSFSLTFLP